PVGFLPGNIGQFFREFGLTVAIAAFFSLLVARLITPMMAAYMLKDIHHEAPEGAITDLYRSVLGWAIRRPMSAMGMGLGVFILSIAVPIPVFMNFPFMPRYDTASVQINIEPPPGAPIHDADRTVQQIAADIGRLVQVQDTFGEVHGVDGGATTAS